MVFSFEKHDQKPSLFAQKCMLFSQCIFGPLGANGGQRGTTGDHGGPRPVRKKSRPLTNYSSTNAAGTPQAALVWGMMDLGPS